MRLEILHVPDCPGAPILEHRLAEVLADNPVAQVVQHEITTQEEAERTGMTGSPTLLVDGTDPFARPGQQPGISCRLYRDADGRPGPAPSVTQLHGVLDARAAGA
ncbi:MAG TPA: thioredoxin family protein [Streptosporangiaceae bacterium]